MWKYVLFWLTFGTIGRLPTRLLYAVFGIVADVLYVLAAGSRHGVWDNLRHVVPPDTPKREIRRMARQIFRNVALYYVDLARMPYTDTHHLFHERMKVHGLYENLIPAVEAGNGVIMLSAHCGNPELAAQGLIPVGVKLFALTEPLAPPRLSRLLDRVRSSRGHEFGPVSIGNVKRVMKTLRSGGTVALMGDRDIEGPRQRLPFFGVETWMPTGPIEVAMRTGATVIPSFNARKDDYVIEAHMQKPLEWETTGDFKADVRAGVLAYLERLESWLREDPGRWLVLEPIWDTDDVDAAVPTGAAEHEHQPSR
ncbi:MAG: lysophospholipid acyltransferase family protein [Dehalococcoidia bacterium]